LRLRPKSAEAKGYKAEADILAWKPVWPRGSNISASTANLGAKVGSACEEFDDNDVGIMG